MADHFATQSEEIARMQELSSDWKPEYTGPLVSDRRPSSQLVSEYASAEPIYQLKTSTLAHKYAQYRTCRGDGLCGWRAVAFSYFELLPRLGGKERFVQEQQRLLALESATKQGGFLADIYEDFRDATFDLLTELSDADDAEKSLMTAFTDESRSTGILTYVKILTSSWLRMHASRFQNFIPHMPVEQFCIHYIDPTYAQLDHVSLAALYELLVEPVGIGMEILYLDQSAGEEVVPTAHQPPPASGPAIAWFRLLYRPGHYDILYKTEDISYKTAEITRVAIGDPASHTQSDLVVGYSRSQSVQLDHPAPLGYTANDFEIPGMGFFPSQHGSGKSWDPLDAALNYRSVQPSLEPQPRPQMQSHTNSAEHVAGLSLRSAGYRPEALAITCPPAYYSEASVSPLVMSPAAPLSPTGSAPRGNDTIFRQSVFMWEQDRRLQAGRSDPNPNPVILSPSFRHSHYNKSHFQSENFTPEQWNPEKEYREGKRNKRPDPPQ